MSGRPNDASFSASVAPSASARPAGVMVARTTRLSSGDMLRRTSPRCSSFPMALVTAAGWTMRRLPILPMGSEPLRVNALDGDHVFFRSLATRGARELPANIDAIIGACQAAGYDLGILETP